MRKGGGSDWQLCPNWAKCRDRYLPSCIRLRKVSLFVWLKKNKENKTKRLSRQIYSSVR